MFTSRLALLCALMLLNSKAAFSQNMKLVFTKTLLPTNVFPNPNGPQGEIVQGGILYKGKERTYGNQTVAAYPVVYFETAELLTSEEVDALWAASSSYKIRTIIKAKAGKSKNYSGDWLNSNAKVGVQISCVWQGEEDEQSQIYSHSQSLLSNDLSPFSAILDSYLSFKVWNCNDPGGNANALWYKATIAAPIIEIEYIQIEITQEG